MFEKHEAYAPGWPVGVTADASAETFPPFLSTVSPGNPATFAVSDRSDASATDSCRELVRGLSRSNSNSTVFDLPSKLNLFLGDRWRGKSTPSRKVQCVSESSSNNRFNLFIKICALRGCRSRIFLLLL